MRKTDTTKNHGLCGIQKAQQRTAKSSDMWECRVVFTRSVPVEWTHTGFASFSKGFLRRVIDGEWAQVLHFFQSPQQGFDPRSCSSVLMTMFETLRLVEYAKVYICMYVYLCMFIYVCRIYKGKQELGIGFLIARGLGGQVAGACSGQNVCFCLLIILIACFVG